jgi:hypothetical protein
LRRSIVPVDPPSTPAYARGAAPRGEMHGYPAQQQLEPSHQNRSELSRQEVEQYRPARHRGGWFVKVLRTLVVGFVVFIAVTWIAGYVAAPVTTLVHQTAQPFAVVPAPSGRNGTQVERAFFYTASRCNGICIHCSDALAITGDKGRDVIRCPNCGGTMYALVAIQKHYYCSRGYDPDTFLANRRRLYGR